MRGNRGGEKRGIFVHILVPRRKNLARMQGGGRMLLREKRGQGEGQVWGGGGGLFHSSFLNYTPDKQWKNGEEAMPRRGEVEKDTAMGH